MYLWYVYVMYVLGTNKMLLTSSNIRPNMFCEVQFLTEAILSLVNTCPVDLQNA